MTVTTHLVQRAPGKREPVNEHRSLPVREGEESGFDGLYCNWIPGPPCRLLFYYPLRSWCEYWLNSRNCDELDAIVPRPGKGDAAREVICLDREVYSLIESDRLSWFD